MVLEETIFIRLHRCLRGYADSGGEGPRKRGEGIVD